MALECEVLEGSNKALDDEGVKDEEILFRKISWHLLPLFLVMVILCYVDRTNLAFAGRL